MLALSFGAFFLGFRLFQRGMLPHTHVQAALRWRAEDADADVRRTAFLLSLFTRARLVQTLRARDPELHRQLVEEETRDVAFLPIYWEVIPVFMAKGITPSDHRPFTYGEFFAWNRE
jgi:hypothetical protein